MGKQWKSQKRPISLEELKAHNKRRSCWVAIHGEVYDLTRYIVKHPGGDIILKGAGIDATHLFTKSNKYGHDHSNGAFEVLKQYHIGYLNSAH
jgi:cytochrome b involved in lipid metabolism